MFGKLFTLGKGIVAGAAESAIDKNAIVILEQELRDGKAALARAHTELSKIVGQKKLAQQKWDEAEVQFLRLQESGRKANEAGNAELAQKVAERLGTLNTEGTSLREQIDQYAKLEASLRVSVTKTGDRLKQVEREISAVKATEAVQRAQSTVMSGATGANSNANSAMASLERLKARQIGRQAELDAADELHEAMSGGDLEKELASAGFLENKSAGFGGGFGGAAGFGARPALGGTSPFEQKQLGQSPADDPTKA